MVEYTYSVSLRLWHPAILSREITSALEIEPQHSGDVGSPNKTPNGTPLKGVYKETFWTARILNGVSGDRSLTNAIEATLDQLQAEKTFFDKFASTGGKAELFIGWFFDDGNSGEVFGHRLLGRLSDLNLDLSFDVYADLSD